MFESIFFKICLVILVACFIIGFFKKFRTHDSKNFYSNAEYGKKGPPENYGQGGGLKGVMSKVKGKASGSSGGSSSGGSAQQ